MRLRNLLHAHGHSICLQVEAPTSILSLLFLLWASGKTTLVVLTNFSLVEGLQSSKLAPRRRKIGTVPLHASQKTKGIQ